MGEYAPWETLEEEEKVQGGSCKSTFVQGDTAAPVPLQGSQLSGMVVFCPVTGYGRPQERKDGGSPPRSGYRGDLLDWPFFLAPFSGALTTVSFLAMLVLAFIITSCSIFFRMPTSKFWGRRRP